MNAIIEVEEVTKRYGSIIALDDLSLSFKRGINGFLGPNGAGKTTTLQILIGLIKPDAGKVSVLGFDPISDGLKVRELIGFFPEFDVLNLDVEADKFIIHMGMVSGLSRETAVKQLNRIANFLGLGEEIHRELNTLSQGMKQKVKLAIALISDPEVLLLDEPTAGLDPVARNRMLRLVKMINKELDRDVIVSTHILRDVEQICDHLVVINSGKKVFEGPISSILKPLTSRLMLRVSTKPNEKVYRLLEMLEKKGYKTEYSEDENIIQVDFQEKNRLTATKDIVNLVRELNLELRILKDLKPSLDDVFSYIVGGGE